MDETANSKPEILLGYWSDLKPHAERGAVFLVHQDLDLTDVAQKIAADDVVAIRDWLDSSLLSKPNLDQIERWSLDPTRTFNFAIVQPYVLMQELGH